MDTMSKGSIPAQRGSDQSFLVFDLSTLRFEWLVGSRRLGAFTPSRRLLGAREIPQDTSDREAVFELLDQLLSDGVPGDEGQVSCALYNPTTWQVAVHSIPDTVSFGDHIPLDLEFDGSAAVLSAGVFVIGNRRLAVLEPSMHLVRQAFAAHRE